MSLAALIPVGTTPVNLITLRPAVRSVTISAKQSAIDLYFATQASQLPLTTSNGTLVSAGTSQRISFTPGVASLEPFTVQAVAASANGTANCRSSPI